MIELTARLLITQAQAHATRLAPRFSAWRASFSAMARLSGRHSDSSMRLSRRPARVMGSAASLTLYLPVKDAASERAVGHDAESERPGRREHLDLGLAVHEVVVRLE